MICWRRSDSGRVKSGHMRKGRRMAPFCIGPGSTTGAGIGRNSFHGIGTARRHRFRSLSRGSSSLLASAALLAARGLLPTGALLGGCLLLRSGLATGLLRRGLLAVRGLLATILFLCGGFLRAGLASGLLLRGGLLAARPHCQRQCARLFGGWGFFVTHL